MDAISFVNFKQNCKHLGYSFTQDISICCDKGHSKKTRRNILGVLIESHFCKEKDCPVLQRCKKIGGHR